jgi:hypothetical protein
MVALQPDIARKDQGPPPENTVMPLGPGIESQLEAGPDPGVGGGAAVEASAGEEIFPRVRSWARIWRLVGFIFIQGEVGHVVGGPKKSQRVAAVGDAKPDAGAPEGVPCRFDFAHAGGGAECRQDVRPGHR